jgi:hypothetical protein
MGYPKAVLIDCLLPRLLFEIDWRELEIKAILLRQRTLLAKAQSITEAERTARIGSAKWLKLDEEWERIQRELSRSGKKLDALLGIDHDRTSIPED